MSGSNLAQCGSELEWKVLRSFNAHSFVPSYIGKCSARLYFIGLRGIAAHVWK